MALLRFSILANPPHNISFSKTITPRFLHTELNNLSLHQTTTNRNVNTVIRMGGGPRTFPGGVSKWQWKRMQAKKAKQLLKARLTRERQIYEMRKRAELKAAVSELERPWEMVKRAPNLFSVGADEQLKVLADRFQKPGGFDMWSDKDGPQLFETVDGLPSARFFPKGVVHSVKPYAKITDEGSSQPNGAVLNHDEVGGTGNVPVNKSGKKTTRMNVGGDPSANKIGSGREGKKGGRNANKTGIGREGKRGEKISSRQGMRRENDFEKSKKRDGGVYDMSLQQDGSYS